MIDASDVFCYGTALWGRALTDDEIMLLNGPPCPEKDVVLAEATSRSGCFEESNTSSREGCDED